MLLSLPPGWGTPIGWVAPYHLALLAALLAGAVLFTLQMRRVGLEWGRVASTLPLVIALPVAGARLTDILVYAPEILEHPFDLLKVLGGGLSSHGAFLGLSVLAYFLSRLYRADVGVVADRLIFWGLLGAAAARVGDIFHAQGVGIPSDIPFAVSFDMLPDRGAVSRHPTNLYELVLVAVLLVSAFFLLARLGKKRPGVVATLLSAAYFLLRVPIDSLREVALIVEEPRVPVAHPMSLTAAVLFVAALLWFLKRRPHDGPKPSPRGKSADRRPVSWGRRIAFIGAAAVVAMGFAWITGYLILHVRFTSGRAVSTLLGALPMGLIFGVPLLLVATGAGRLGILIEGLKGMIWAKILFGLLFAGALFLTFGALVFLPMALGSVIVLLFAAALPFFRSRRDLIVYLIGGGAFVGLHLALKGAAVVQGPFSTGAVMVLYGYGAVIVSRLAQGGMPGVSMESDG